MEKLTVPPLDTDDGLSFVWNYLLAHRQPRSDLNVDDRVLGFLGHCVAGLRDSKAQLFQDLYVTWKLAGKRGGYFVEFGAMDGVILSNTCSLERILGWDGILAEPFPMWHAALRAQRRAKIDARCVWWESGKQLEFLATHKNPELATIAEFADGDYEAPRRTEGAETIMVETVSLDDLLAEHDAPETIDYLSVDTEGSELDILSAFDFVRHKVRIITVEHNFRPDIRGSIQQLLTAHGFVRELEAFSRFDDWYFHPGRV